MRLELMQKYGRLTILFPWDALLYVTSVEIRKSGVDRDQGWDMGDGITYLCDMLNQRILMPY